MMHTRFCKRVLVIHSFLSNMSSRAEVSILPVSIFVSILIIKYWLYIIKVDLKRIVYQAYCSERQLDEHHIHSCVTFIKSLLSKCDVYTEWKNHPVHDKTSFLK